MIGKKPIAFENSQKGYDPNSCFSGISFFSGLSLWAVQFEKRSLTGYLFFNADFSKIFLFHRCNQLICKILAPNPKSELSGACIITSSKFGVCFYVIMSQFLSERINCGSLFRFEK